jgi:predicted extracellular nuclease
VLAFARVRSLLAAVVCLAACASESTPLPGVVRDTGVAPDTAAADAISESPLPPPRAGAIRVAALNVHRLFDQTCDTGSCATGDYEAVLTDAQINKRVTRIAERLRFLNADVIMIEEVETAALLDAIAAQMPGFVTHVLGEIGFAASVDVGVLARFPTVSIKTHRDQILFQPDGSPTTFAREFLEVHLDRGGRTVIAFAAHFRSKSSDDPGRRYAEAVAARDIVASAATENPDALVVFGGDLNDVPGSPPIVAIDEKLARVSIGLPDESIATYWFEGRGQAIDHIYVSGAARFLAGTFLVDRDPGARTFAGSDHAAVHADFD